MAEIRASYGWSLPGGLVERPGHYPGQPELWVYLDEFSYVGGERVRIRVHTTCDRFDVEVIRDGALPHTVLSKSGLPGKMQQTAADAYAVGCNWDEACAFTVDSQWSSGLYLVIVGAEHEGRRIEGVGFFIVRPMFNDPETLVLLHTTSTLLAYNDWGGANYYRGVPDGSTDIPTPVSAARRPIAHGMLRKPAGAPRNADPSTPGPNWTPRYPVYEWAWQNGFSRHHADAGWATYERPFTVWAEQNGYRLGHITQTDLHRDPHLLDGARCVVIVGHDEYWTWEMRDHIDQFVERGGHLARLAGNFLWQVRLSNDGYTQTCYKDPHADPLRTAHPRRVTTAWDAPLINRPGALTMGLTGLAGVYNRYGAAAARSSGGFTVYRHSHWAFAETGLGYGDVFGGVPACVAAFEMDGVDYTFRKGLPYPTGADGAPTNLEILAMAPAVAGTRDRWDGTVAITEPLDEMHQMIDAFTDGDPPEHLRDLEYGSGMVAAFTRGRGTVFCAGTTEWVNGLALGEPFTEMITRNVLNRFLTDNETGARE